MKILKSSALFLALFMLISAFFGCEMADEKTDIGSESSLVNLIEDENIHPRVAEIDSVVSESIVRTLPSKNVLLGKEYTSSREVSPDYPDNGGILTDGLEPIGFNRDIWAGYNSQSYESLEITVDLGEIISGIADFSACVLQYSPYGIKAPDSMTVLVAGEDRNFVDVGTAYIPSDIGDESYRMTLNLSGSVTARYITFRFNKPQATWLFVGEIRALAFGEEYTQKPETAVDGKEFYGFKGLPEGEEVFWSESDADYGKTIAFKPEKAYIYAHGDVDEEYAIDWYNTKNTAILYDGKSASSADISNNSWFRVTRAEGRDIIYDLGRISSVEGFEIGFLKQVLAGVNAPITVGVEVSLDGTNWQTVYTQWMPDSAGDAMAIRLKEEIDPIRGRFVKFSLTLNSHVYLDEISVYGNKNTAGASEPDPEKSLVPEMQNYITAEDFDGADNILLSYNGLLTDAFDHDESGLITVEEYLPYVAYLDEEGNVVDTFFDGFVFLPYGAFNQNDFVRKAEGWKHYVEDIYYPDRNMNALDQCVGNVSEALSLSDYKVKVYTAVLRPWSEYEFGDIDGDGVNEDFNDIDDRKKAVKWMMDEELRLFNEGNYGNLEFHGFYWFEEEIYYGDPLEVELVKYAVDYAHSLGVKMIWIPFNGGKGTYDWKSFGFDLVSRQPNYMFGITFENTFLYDTAEAAQKYGMCVEMEISDINDFNDIWRFYEYMRVGAETGYMSAVKIYYQEGVPGPVSDAYNSDDPTMRKFYEDIYSYAKGEYSDKTDQELAVTQNGDNVTSKNRSLKISCVCGENSEYDSFLTLAVAPRYGSVRVNRDGSVIYIPAKDFVGEDSFGVRLSVGNDCGEITYITVNVE